MQKAVTTIATANKQADSADPYPTVNKALPLYRQITRLAGVHVAYSFSRLFIRDDRRSDLGQGGPEITTCLLLTSASHIVQSRSFVCGPVGLDAANRSYEQIARCGEFLSPASHPSVATLHAKQLIGYFPYRQ